MIFLNIALATAPVVIILYVVLSMNQYSRYNRKKSHAMIAAGLLTVIFSAIMNGLIYNYTIFDPYSSDPAASVSGYLFALSINPEFFKLFFILLFIYSSVSDESPREKALRAVCVGAVFAAFEGLTPFYFETYTLAIRLFTHIPFHILNTVVMVFFIQRFFASKGYEKMKSLAAAWLVPVVIHWLYKIIFSHLYGWCYAVPGVILSGLFVCALVKLVREYYDPAVSPAYR